MAKIRSRRAPKGLFCCQGGCINFTAFAVDFFAQFAILSHYAERVFWNLPKSAIMHRKSTISEEKGTRGVFGRIQSKRMQASAGFLAINSLLSLFTSPNVGVPPDIMPEVTLVEEVNRAVSSLTNSSKLRVVEGIGEYYDVMREDRYIAKEGDTIGKIVEAYKDYGFWVRPDQVRTWNKDRLKNPDVLQPGQELVVPVLRWSAQVVPASWYGPGFHGKKTASGERYDQHAMTVAHKWLPLGMPVVVTNIETGKSVEARVTDRGAFEDKYSRGLDVSFAIAKEIGIYEPGVAMVEVRPVQDMPLTQLARN